MNGKSQSNGQIGRQILSFADFKKKISLIPMDEEIRKIILERVNKYPEASLDYVWKRLQDFVSAASRERSVRNKKLNQAVTQNKIETPKKEVSIAEVMELPQKIKLPPKPSAIRPALNLEEFDIPNKEVENDTVS